MTYTPHDKNYDKQQSIIQQRILSNNNVTRIHEGMDISLPLVQGVNMFPSTRTVPHRTAIHASTCTNEVISPSNCEVCT